MRQYISFFKLKFAVGLQYKAAALAGMSTQFFFGIIYVSVYIAFYQSDSSNLPMPLNQLVSFLWLNQCFFALIFMWYIFQYVCKYIILFFSSRFIFSPNSFSYFHICLEL